MGNWATATWIVYGAGVIVFAVLMVRTAIREKRSAVVAALALMWPPAVLIFGFGNVVSGLGNWRTRRQWAAEAAKRDEAKTRAWFELQEETERLLASIDTVVADANEKDGVRSSLLEVQAARSTPRVSLYYLEKAAQTETSDLTLFERYVSLKALEEEADRRSGVEVHFYRVEPDSTWALVFTTEFIKSLDGLDRKLLGKVLEALGFVSRDPTTLRGDTVKPLEGDLRGMWRYRLGDWRLIYLPVPHDRVVQVLRLSSRASAYAP